MSERDDFEGYSSSLITGATVQGTLAAVTNSLNGAKTYVDSVYCGLVQPFDGYEYLDYINRNSTTVEVSGTDVTYNIVTNSNGFAGSFEIQITVGADGAISAYTIVTNGSTNGYGSNMAEIANDMVGAKRRTALKPSSTATTCTRALPFRTRCACKQVCLQQPTTIAHSPIIHKEVTQNEQV